MQTRIAKVTPEIASAWLEKNTINRPLRKSVVKSYVNAYTRGEHRLTHQGIAFSVTGELLDGQHRLTAIAQMPKGFAAEMMVSTDLPTSAFDAIDQGLKRSHSDVLRIPQANAAVARFLGTIQETSKVGITSQYLIPFVEGIDEHMSVLLGFSPKNTKTWSNAAIRSAAVLQLANGGNRDYICMAYYALNHMDFEAMPAVAQALFRQHTKGAIPVTGYDLFCRAFKMFDSRNAKLEVIQISDQSNIIAKAREIIRTKILGSTGVKKAPVSPGAKKAMPANSKVKTTA